jgi:signal transduction histidine kinase
MQVLSLQAIFLFYGIFLFSILLLMAWLFRRNVDESARLWMSATLLSALATSITAWRADLPAWLGFLLPNILEFGHPLLAALAVRALMGPVPRLGRLIALTVVAVAVLGTGLTWLAEYQRQALVPYVSAVNGLLMLWALWLIRRGQLPQADLPLVRILMRVLVLKSLIWLARIPVFFLGQGAHAMDPQWSNWLIFVSLLVVGIMVQIAYIGVRFANAYDNRLALERMRMRLQITLTERDALLRQHHALSGTLALQIAHEVNQPLGAIRLSLESAAIKPYHEIQPAELEDLLRDIDRISASLACASALTAKPAPDLHWIESHDLVSKLVLAAQLAGLSIVLRDKPCVLQVRCDADLLAEAWVAALKRLCSESATSISLDLVPIEGDRVQLNVLTLPVSQACSHAALQLGRIPEGMSAQDADIFLDLLRLEHLVRSYAGRLSMHFVGEDRPQLTMELVLPARVDQSEAFHSETTL